MTRQAKDELRWGRRILFILAGGAFGFVLTWFLSGLFGVATDSTAGIDAVLTGVMPACVIFGVVAGAFVAYKFERRRSAK